MKFHPMEPAESPTLSLNKHVGRHRIQGISDEFIPPLVALDQLDEIIPVPDGDAIRMAQKLARELGLGVGISSGANFLAALEAQERLGAGATVVTIFCDDNKKYLSAGLGANEPLKPGYRAQHVELLSVEVVPSLSKEVMGSVRGGSWREMWRRLLNDSVGRADTGGRKKGKRKGEGGKRKEENKRACAGGAEEEQ